MKNYGINKVLYEVKYENGIHNNLCQNYQSRISKDIKKQSARLKVVIRPLSRYEEKKLPSTILVF